MIFINFICIIKQVEIISSNCFLLTLKCLLLAPLKFKGLGVCNKSNLENTVEI